MSTTSSKKNDHKVSSSQSSRQIVENKSKTKISTRVPQTNIKKEEKDKTKVKTTQKSLKKSNEDNVEKLTKSHIISQRNRVQNITSLRNISKTKQEKPTSPPSKRVIKTQYFPSKKLYSNALNINESKSKNLDSNIKKGNILSTKNIKKYTNITLNSIRKKEISNKVISNNSSPDVSVISERPGTATLRKGSIVNTNIVGPDIPKSKVVISKQLISNTSSSNIEKSSRQETPSPEEVNYEEDFDSYESDFEGYQSSESSSTSLNISEISNENISSSTSSVSLAEIKSVQKRINSGSTDEEKKFDSGNYELPENRHMQILDNIKEAIEKENANLTIKQNQQSNLTSLSDEGFEDAKSLQFINFLGAQKKYQHRKYIEKQRKRGEEILNMIRLDTFSFTLLDIAPVPYEIFIKHFGKSNTLQISVQTGEDNIHDETQTDKVDEVNKWTQYPAALSQIDKENRDFWNIYKNNYLGVGEEYDKNKLLINDNIRNNYNETKLEKFLLSAGNLILKILIENNNVINEIPENCSSNIPFSKLYVSFAIQSQEILRNRPINHVSFSKLNSDKILSVHNKPRNENIKDSIVCLWTISNPNEPQMLLTTYGEVTCCCFDLNSINLIFGGLDDGCIVIWDTKENSKNYKIISTDQNKILQKVSYRTDIQYGHEFKIVSIHSLPYSLVNKNVLVEPSQTKEICSLDEKGDIIIWSIIIKHQQNEQLKEDQDFPCCGFVRLVKNVTISLKKLYPQLNCLYCTDSIISYLDPNHIYISTNYGFIMHNMLNGARSSVQKFYPSSPQSEATCLETCPFSPLYILCGFNDGNISFYSRSLERTLMTMSNKHCNTSKCNIQLIQWSYNRPLIFYTKDITNRINVWNLKASDMFPTYSIPFKENIVCMKLSPSKYDKKETDKTFMLIATEMGAIYLYLLNDEHGKQTFEQYKEDTRKFLNYINRYV